MLRINRGAIVAMAVEGQAKAPIARNWIVNVDGTSNMGIGCAGIHYNVKIGDGVRQFEGDYDIQTSDPKANAAFGLDRLRMGDFVALLDQDGTYGYSFHEGAVTIGVIIHADSPVAGHGPGVQVLLTTTQKGIIRPVIQSQANLGRYLRIGRWRKGA
jgi:hypothetical protein